MRNYIAQAAFGAALLASGSLAEEVERKTDSCTALVLSGGGSNGAWEAGVFWGLLNYGEPDDFKYDVLSGISAGSINSVAMVGWPIGQEKQASQWISDMWRALHTSDIW